MKVTRDRTQSKRSPNRRKLTPLLVDKVAPGERRKRIWDTDAPGLVLQVEPSGSRTWYAYYRRNGRPRWYRLGAVGGLGLSAARDVVRRLNARLVLDTGYDPQAEKVASRMQGKLTELVERYVADHLDNLKSGDQGAYLLRRLFCRRSATCPPQVFSDRTTIAPVAGRKSPQAKKPHGELVEPWEWCAGCR
ncbi:MAG: Arm DNA-binding domain-containing protein [Alphaproteobacteria bacterium]|nr:Arm DNA-binding domain-containing protein [Alphaproteobacteria bacterium]